MAEVTIDHRMIPAGMSTSYTNPHLEAALAAAEAEGFASLRASLEGMGMHVPDSMTLSPAMIMHMLQTRLRDLDAQIGSQVNAIETASRAAETMSTAVDALQRIRGEITARNADGKEKMDPNTITVKVGDEDLTLTQIVERYGLDALPLDSESRISGNALDPYIDAQKGSLQKINSGNEMRMVQMQTLTQERSQAISLSTQLLRTIADSEKKITDNIR